MKHSSYHAMKDAFCISLSDIFELFAFLLQVFGRLITDDSAEDKLEEKKVDDVDGESGTARDNDLKEHMLGILFSRGSKLSHLQKQVKSSLTKIGHFFILGRFFYFFFI